jgi:3-oxoadipate enol-lactonase
MPAIDSQGCPIDAEISGPAGAPVLMLSNSLGTTRQMWDPQMDAFAQRYRVIRYDRRGHGRSGAPNGPYSMEMLARDALAVMDGLGVQKAHWLGLSMGGMEGMWLGANAPDRIDRLILSNTTSHYPDRKPWDDRIRLVREQGLGAIVPGNMERWFTRDFRERAPETIARMTDIFLGIAPEGYIGCCEAIAAMDHRPLLPKIGARTLVIAGEHDPATPVAAGEALKAQIPGAQLAVVAASHIANVEQPEAYAKEVLGFLAAR